ncbi:ferredoxin--NADP reductase [Shewanella sp. C32]|uniref:ferredoxin--NADP(+) reductase n=1 Tax=Shewanella electrica TaxID=515560 RepID=A0ABT2FIC1_9GAMM|nr:ferredoxin--NADP reductase [Shewanella electrica]MCH1924172.1 ferredoxin--NADP reductase [Shewanella electrica]MCS4556075.1 ferredoxin--NADP reductase [Shewanella electrica]
MIPQALALGKVVRRIDWTAQQFSIVVQADIAPFVAGQFTKLALQNEQGDWIRRAYSIVNSPQEYAQTGELEFLIVAAPNGQLSAKLQLLQQGDAVGVGKQSSGFMTLAEVPSYAKELWLMASGTGIGPYISMLKFPSLPFEKIVLVHAVRTEADLVYASQIAQLQAHHHSLTFVKIVSRENVNGVLSGRIPQLLRNGALEQAASLSLDPDSSFVYLCGNPSMVKDTGVALNERGLNKHLRRAPGHYSFENYW